MRVSTLKGECGALELVLEQGEQGGTQYELTTAASPRKATFCWKALIGVLGGFAILAFAALTIQQQPEISQTVSRRSNSDFDALPVCAQEGGDCTCGGQSDITVAYGANGQYNVHNFMSSSVACTNEVFGDPIGGIEKACRCIPTPSAFTREENLVLQQTWVHCANEGEWCVCPHNGKKRFGGDGVFVEDGKYNSPRSRFCAAIQFVGNGNYWGPDVVKTCQCLVESAEEVQRPLTPQEYAKWQTFYSEWDLDCADATPGPPVTGLPESCTCKASHCSFQGDCVILAHSNVSNIPVPFLDCDCNAGRTGPQCQIRPFVILE